MSRLVLFETPEAEMLIIVGRDHASLHDGLKPRQEANDRDRVILDRRIRERRRGPATRTSRERRTGERRAPVSEADRALLSVLGFMILRPDRQPAVQPAVRLAPVASPAGRSPERAAGRRARAAGRLPERRPSERRRAAS